MALPFAAAEAGPSSSSHSATATASNGESDGQERLQSFRQLYFTLEAANPSIPSTSIQARLKQLLPKLKASCDPLPPCSTSYSKKLSSGSITTSSGKPVKLDAPLQEIVKQCSALYNIDEVEMAIGMQSYVDSDDANLSEHTTDHIAVPTRNRKRGKADVGASLSEAFSVYFFEERLYALRCINALLRIADDNFHELNSIAEDVVRQIVDQPFGLHCLARMESLCIESLSEQIREIPRYSTFMAKYALRQQIALLEIAFLIYYSRLDSTSGFVASVHRLAQKTDFGRRQVNSGFYDVEAASLLDCISHLLVLLCIESLDLERAIDGLDLLSASTSQSKRAATSQTERPWTEDPQLLGEVMDFLRTSTVRDKVRGPLLVGWALLVNRIDTAFVDWKEARPTEPLPERLQGLITVLDGRGGAGALWTELVNAALTPELSLFPTLIGIARSPLISWHVSSTASLNLALSSSLAMRAVLKGLVISVTELIRPEYLQDYNGFIHVWQHTFANEDVDHRAAGQVSDSAAALCAQFWQVDYEHEQRRALLTTSTRRFPVSFRPLVNLCRALSGSGPGALHTSDEALRSSSAVLSYLASLETITQVIPSSTSLSAPYEMNVTRAGEPASFRATRPIPVFGRHLVIPTGTEGRMISAENQSPVVMIWHLNEGSQDVDNSFSAWRLMRDVLSRFANLLDRKDEFTSEQPNDGSVFQDRSAIASFAKLAPDEAEAFDGDVASDIMDLFSSVLATESDLSSALLAHLQGEDLDHVNQVQPTAHVHEHRQPSLIATTLAILNQSLAVPSSASRVIISSYRLLTLAISTSRTEEVWLPLRSSGLLTGMYGALSYTAQSGLRSSSKTTSLLEFEMSIGRYAGLLALLDFHNALLVDVQQSAYALSAADSELKVDIILRALRFISEKVWVAYQGWKYVRIRQRIEIGRKCVQIFDRILRDDTLPQASPSLGRLRRAVESIFVDDAATPTMLGPLLNTVASGQSYIGNLQLSSRHFEVEMAREQVEASLCFARRVVLARRRSNASKLGLIERAFVEGTTWNQRDASFDKAGQREQGRAISLTEVLINSPFSSQLTSNAKIEAIKLITCVCIALLNSVDHISAVPSLVGRLGSLPEVGSLIQGYLSLIRNPHEDYALRFNSFDLLSALTKSQPGIATLLLTGRHVASTASDDDSHEKTITTTATELAAKIVEDTRDIGSCSSDQLHILGAALKFLVIAWEHVTEHQREFETIRKSKTFWNTLLALAQHAESVPSTSPTRVLPAGGRSETDCDADNVRFALLKTCSAQALHLLALDVNVPPSLDKTQTGKSASRPMSTSLAAVMDLVRREADLLPSLHSALRVQSDPLRHLDVIYRIEQTFPELCLDHFRLPIRLDEFDQEKKPGSSYVYDVDAFQFKLEGLLRAAVNAGQDDSMLDADAITQAVLLVAGVNLDWSSIDAQSVYLCAWTSLMSTVIGPMYDQMDVDQVLRRDVRRTMEQVWAECAQVVADEELSTEIVRDIHALRVSLLAVLLEMAWGVPTNTRENRQLRHDYGKEGNGMALSILQQAVRVVTHPQLSIEDSMRKTPLDVQGGVHRDAARMMLLCSERYRAARKELQGGKGGDAELLRDLQRCAETLTSQIVICMRIALDRCLFALNTHQRRTGVGEEGATNVLAGLDLDLQLFASSLASLLHQESGLSVHIWLPKLHATNLFETASDLFSRSPLMAMEGAESLTNSRLPLHCDTLLDLFLNLACQEGTCEPLILSGVMNALCTNALSQQADSMFSTDGQSETSPPLNPRRGGGSLMGTVLHVQWIKVLRVVMALISTLEPAQRFTFIQSEVASFYRIFFPIFESTLSRSLTELFSFGSSSLPNKALSQRRAGKASPFHDKGMTHQLEELDLVAGVCMHTLKTQYVDIRGESRSLNRQHFLVKITDSFVGRGSVRLQETVHLLQLPSELKAFLGVDGDAANGTAAKKTLDVAVRYLVQASMNIVETFWFLSKGLDILCASDASEWSLHDVLIVPTIGTSIHRPASTGTLLDLASYLSDTLRVNVDDTLAPALIAALEQTVALASVQLALCMHASTPAEANGKDDEGSLARSAKIRSIDVEAGLGRDVAQATESVKGALQQFGNDSTRKGGGKEGQGGKNSIPSLVAFVDVVLAFQRRWLISSE